ncbi:MAG: hypothetical protein QOI58_1745 [Thermoanaerobaculia bacterium]|jgi:hypothetical protein|nr:hypothetical protein [Thermoanaerobaculia bacterium]
MRRLSIAFLLGLLMASVCAEAQQAPQADFTVIFDGIILHAFPIKDSNGKLIFPNPRAFVIEGGAFSKRHYPTLIIKKPDIDVASLRDATGQPVSCTPEECRVPIIRYAMRIGTDDGNAVSGPPTVDKTFKTLTPHMSCITKGGGIQGIVTHDLPEGPIAGFFELLGNSLNACAFVDKAFFVPDSDNEGVRYFSDLVTLSGTVSNGPAVLQIRSYSTTGWKTVARINATTPLQIIVENHSHATQPTSTHFSLNSKLIVTAVPLPVVCANDAADAFCQNAKKQLTPRPPDQSEDACFPVQPLKICEPPLAPPVMPMMTRNAPGGNLEAMAGCANSQWP